MIEVIDDALVAMLDNDDVGEDVQYDQSGNVQTIRGVFQREDQLVEGREVGRISSSSPRLTVRIADLNIAPRKQQDLVTIRGVVYRVVAVKPDGEGGAELVLKQE